MSTKPVGAAADAATQLATADASWTTSMDNGAVHAADDPGRAVAEPVHRALELLILRGAASFAVAILAVTVTLVELGEPAHTLGHLALPAVLAFVVVARGVHMRRHRHVPRDATWVRAHALERHETELAALVALAVPLAWLAGGAAILARHAADHASLSAVVGVWVPAGGALWALASIAWAGDCRERLSLALEESERRYRSYWQGIARST
jgi:hypothetical protein